jgi:hypothetical protein
LTTFPIIFVLTWLSDALLFAFPVLFVITTALVAYARLITRHVMWSKRGKEDNSKTPKPSVSVEAKLLGNDFAKSTLTGGRINSIRNQL